MDYTTVVIVIPKEQFESIAGQVENWALIGPDEQTYDEASGLMTMIEENWDKL